MSFTRKIFSQLQNCEEIVIWTCKELNVKITETSIKTDLIEHPDYPSLLATSDVMKKYGIDNISLKINIENLSKLQLPLIAQVKGKHSNQVLFSVITKLNNQTITWYNPELKKKETISLSAFTELFTGYVQLLETTEYAGEKDYKLKRKREKINDFTTNILISSLPFLTLLIALNSSWQIGFSNSILPIIFAILTLTGVAVSLLLILFEIDQHNPTLKKVCNSSKKVNCTAILSSPHSKLLGVSWAVIGFTYFTGLLLTLLAGGLTQPDFLFIAAWLSIMTLPYIIYSIYYQWRIAKQWCSMCLTVQAILLLQFVTALTGGFHSITDMSSLSVTSIYTIILFFIIPFYALILLIPALQKSKENRYNKTSLQRLKLNKQIFEALLTKQTQIAISTEGLGITFGNPNAANRLIKVCNPYCGPCSQAHLIITKLIQQNPELQVQIIFTASSDNGDYRSAPVKHLMAISHQGDAQLTEQALDDWYLAEDKDYSKFSETYSNIEELDVQSKNVQAMHDWCSKMDIQFTPTFFINGKQLPEIYSIVDLQYFLSV